MKTLMIVFLIALMAAADANVIKPSINTNIPFQFSLYNDVGYDLGIYWIDYRGVITYVDLIQAGDTLVKNSNLNSRFFLSTDGLYTEFEDIFLGHDKFKQKNSLINISSLKTPIHLYGQKDRQKEVTTAESVTINPNSDYQARCEFQFNREILNIHNRLRGKHHTSPVGLDTALTNAAQTHATSMAVRNAGMLNAGLFENLSLHGLFGKPADCSSLAKSVGEMYESSEKSYDFNNPGFTLAAGTFSQVVWKSNKLLGCGVAFSSPDQTGMINAYTVCKYQTGNIMGQFKENVLPA